MADAHVAIEETGRVIPRQATFGTQADALLRKNCVFQLRNRRSNCCLTVTPVLFIMLLFIIQKIVNSAFNTVGTRCGCECLRCCDNIIGGSGEVCRDSTVAVPCLPGTYTGNCKTYNNSNCGIQFSDQGNAQFCAISSPSIWPPLLQVPPPDDRAIPARPGVTYLATGDSASTATAISQNLFTVPNLTDTNALATAQTEFASNLMKAEPVVRGDLLSAQGFTLGTTTDTFRSMFVEAAFVTNQPLYNMVPSCNAPIGPASTSALSGILGPRTTGGAINFGVSSVQCTSQDVEVLPNAGAIDRALYCGFHQANCNASAPYSTNAFVQAYDFKASTTSRLELRLWYNDTNSLNVTQAPPYINRLNQGLNMASNAFLRWSLGPQFEARLLGITEMPTAKSRLTLDFSSLLGPVFFAWLCQLLLPIMLVAIVYEKQYGLRIMMKMHGLGEAAYFSVQYLWFLALYCAYIIVLLLIGSAVNIGFFRKNGYGLQIVFYFVWGNCLVATGFLMSTFFKNVRTAVVVGYLYTIGTGLLGYLLFQSLIERGYSWVWVLEIIPAFALYRGLYELSQYSFKASFGSGKGLNFSALNDGYNGMSVALGIMAVEWALFLLLAWYLEQVLPTGTGVRKHPLFFLKSKKRRLRRKNSITDSTPRPTNLDAGGEDVHLSMEGCDVAAERSRVEGLPLDGSGADSIVLRDLRKVYPPQGGHEAKVAVNNLSLGIQRGEVFGLLGPNGAGKTTAIQMMIGFSSITSGEAAVEGLSIKQDMGLIYSLLGVCPQHDLLWEQLSPTHHLNFYGRLKSLKGAELASAVEEGLRSVNLWSVRDKPVSKFSGGMKRRLSVAISFMGTPAVVFLDEPSTGLDPASRRNLWKVIKGGRERAERAIVLTTHSMEEAEILCDRLGIFVDGQLICVGPPRAITAQYGGYLVFTVTVPPAQKDLDAVEDLVATLAPGRRLTYSLGGTLKYELPTAETSLSKVFDAMENAKATMRILDWGVANATLEEVFIKLSRKVGAKGG